MLELRQFFDKFVIYTNDASAWRKLEKSNLRIFSTYQFHDQVFAKEYLFKLPDSYPQTLKSAKRYIKGQLNGIC